MAIIVFVIITIIVVIVIIIVVVVIATIIMAIVVMVSRCAGSAGITWTSFIVGAALATVIQVIQRGFGH